MDDARWRDKADWDLATWEGSRREQIRRWSKLTLDEILEAQEAMADLAADLANAEFTYPRRPGEGGKPG